MFCITLLVIFPYLDLDIEKNTSFNSVDIHPLCFSHTINLCLVLAWNFYLYHKFTWTEWNNDNKEPSTLTLSICILIFFKLGFGSSTCLIWGILSHVRGIWQNTQYGNPDALGNLWQGEGRKEQIWCQPSLSFNSLNRCWGDIQILYMWTDQWTRPDNLSCYYKPIVCLYRR